MPKSNSVKIASVRIMQEHNGPRLYGTISSDNHSKFRKGEEINFRVSVGPGNHTRSITRKRKTFYVQTLNTLWKIVSFDKTDRNVFKGTTAWLKTNQLLEEWCAPEYYV